MDFDIKDFLKAMLVCLLLIVGWQYLQLARRPPVEPGETDQSPTTQVPQSTPGQTPPSITGNEPAEPVPGESSGWHVKAVEAPAGIILGERAETEDGFQSEITIDGKTTSIERVLLNNYKFKVTDEQTGYPLLALCRDERNYPRRSLQMRGLKISGRPETFDLSSGCWQLMESEKLDMVDEQSVSFSAMIVDDEENPVLEVIKTFRNRPGKDQYVLDFELRLVNRAKGAITVEYLEWSGPMGLVREAPRSDRRHIIAAYKLADGNIEVRRQQLLSLKKNPDEDMVEKVKGGSLLWFGSANKFFGAVVRPMPSPSGLVDFIQDNQVNGDLLYLTPEGDEAKPKETQGITIRLAPTAPLRTRGETAFHFQVYLGPISQEIFQQEEYEKLGFRELLYNRPCCSFCTFIGVQALINGLTFLLLGLMGLIYNLVGNYGVAIIILVLLVRLILHPITKKSQVNMMRMQKLQPQMEELRKKYGNNKQEMSKRTMELYKEHGMAGNFLLGCLPMFLQMPIWIALFTAVDGNVAIRHHGLFPASWHWLTDLAAPDRLIPFSWFGVSEPIEVPLLGNLIGGIDAFNLLPILLTVAMYLQTKFSMQAQVSQVNPQAAQQQKMMMYMMPVMMLLFFYTAPSGLNLYIMASTFGGLIEQKFIRKHIKVLKDQEEAVKVTATGKVSERLGPRKRKPKPQKKYFS